MPNNDTTITDNVCTKGGNSFPERSVTQLTAKDAEDPPSIRRGNSFACINPGPKVHPKRSNFP